MNINLDELSKLAFAEVEKELKESKEKESEKETINDAFKEDDKQAFNIVNNEVKANIEKTEISEYEKAYLKKVRERILVLFEALNTKQDEANLQKKLDITIGFIEFLLANIEDRLKN